jgi:hypothetical protein
MALIFDHINNSISTNTGRVSLAINGSLMIPVGTTAQRPASPVQGMIRYNTDLGVFEGFNATNTWQPIGTGSGGGGDGLIYSLIFS